MVSEANKKEPPRIGGSFLFVLRMHREIDEADTAGRADLGALAAAGTLGVVDRRKVAAHGNRICFAVFRTLHATDTPDRTRLARHRALVAV